MHGNTGSAISDPKSGVNMFWSRSYAYCLFEECFPSYHFRIYISQSHFPVCSTFHLSGTAMLCHLPSCTMTTIVAIFCYLRSPRCITDLGEQHKQKSWISPCNIYVVIAFVVPMILFTNRHIRTNHDVWYQRSSITRDSLRMGGPGCILPATSKVVYSKPQAFQDPQVLFLVDQMLKYFIKLAEWLTRLRLSAPVKRPSSQTGVRAFPAFSSVRGMGIWRRQTLNGRNCLSIGRCYVRGMLFNIHVQVFWRWNHSFSFGLVERSHCLVAVMCEHGKILIYCVLRCLFARSWAVVYKEEF